MTRRHCLCPRRPRVPHGLPVCRRCFAALPRELQQRWADVWTTWHRLEDLRRTRRMIRAYTAERLRTTGLTDRD